MTVTSVEHDLGSLTLTLVAEFEAPVERVWEMWSDPRRLERWWGPPTHPATVEEHSLAVGGSVAYFMTGPEGERYHGWWRVTAVDAPRSLEFLDGFADDEGNPNAEMPTTTVRVELIARAGGTRMELRARYESLEAMEQVLEMGMEEGIKLAVGQIDALLAA